jgi:peptidoglycan/xylan/chitin deacetylase (PgdA/CDA1 family)
MKAWLRIFFCYALAIILPSWPAGASIVFSGLDLSEDDRILFRGDQDPRGKRTQGTLFISNLFDSSISQLTILPEEIALLENGRILQVSNAFGSLRLPVTGGIPRSIPGFPSFVQGSLILGGRTEDAAVSGDGRYILHLKPTSFAFGDLILTDTREGRRTLISSNIELPDKYFPACWSPDSRAFIYQRGNRLYYQPAALGSLAQVDDRHRLIGEGAVNSVYWGTGEDFFYIRGSTVYRVRGAELFARVLYAEFLEIGTVAGKIPFEFDYNFDDFWVSPDSRFMLLSKGGRNIFYYPLGTDDYDLDIKSFLPYVMLPRSSFDIRVLWSPSGLVTVIASVLGDGGRDSIAYRLGAGESGMVFTPLEFPRISGAALSPDGAKALLWGEQGILLYDYINWRPLQSLGTRPVLTCLWNGNDEVIAGDEERIERIRLTGGRDLICLSSISEFGFEEGGGRIFAKSGDAWFSHDGRNAWLELSEKPRMRPASLTSGKYRVYLEQGTGPYRSIPMIRDTVAVGTRPLFSAPEYPQLQTGGVQAGEDTLDSIPRDLFIRNRQGFLRETALCFDLYDDAAGLPEVLDALNRVDIRATFFINGEFIRRHPSAVKDIADAGHEIASMFFAPIELSNARYRIDQDFISQGLARNEDEFFQASGGRELSLLWHAPYYAASEDLIQAAGTVGYVTVGRDVDPMDWVSREDERRLAVPQFSAAEIIDQIMDQKKPGSIIPIRLGILPGGRIDYLFGKINVLLDALIRSGYSVVPVSTLIEHTR